jgi:hypothetical protein
MANEQKDSPREKEEHSPAPPSRPQEPCREVTVTLRDSPPPLGKDRIHPRRPAPIVPTREQGMSEGSIDDSETDKSPRE